MDFTEQLQSLSIRIKKQREQVNSEEATRHALVLPFISTLGYDVFDPSEVIPEFTADIGSRKADKVDYAIVQGGRIVMLIECKRCGSDLSSDNCTLQFRKYFHALLEARIGALTDGVIYRFYSDFDNPNIMDATPFLEFDILNIQEPLVAELKRYSKQAFNLTEIMSAATELRYTREIKRILMAELAEPSEELVRIFTKRLYLGGNITQLILNQFAGRVKRVFSQFMSDRIKEGSHPPVTDGPAVPPTKPGNSVPPVTDSNDDRLEFFRQLLDKSKNLTRLFANVSPNGGNHWISAGAGKQGLVFNYIILRNLGRIELILSSADSKVNSRRFQSLKARKDDIEASYGEPLKWDFSDNRKQQYIRSSSTVGGLKDKENWPQIQEDLVNRMVRFERAMKDHIVKLE